MGEGTVYDMLLRGSKRCSANKDERIHGFSASLDGEPSAFSLALMVARMACKRQLVLEDQIYHTATLQMLKLEDWKGPQERFKSIFL